MLCLGGWGRENGASITCQQNGTKQRWKRKREEEDFRKCEYPITPLGKPGGFDCHFWRGGGRKRQRHRRRWANGQTLYLHYTILHELVSCPRPDAFDQTGDDERVVFAGHSEDAAGIMVNPLLDPPLFFSRGPRRAKVTPRENFPFMIPSGSLRGARSVSYVLLRSTGWSTEASHALSGQGCAFDTEELLYSSTI